ncbi:TPA: amidohydrolase [Candidatus Bathyarchaeota archaeon]|nr:amidohydrolase [Candidatus Bathyarchaeota archaeon]
MIIDFHTHFYPYPYLDELRKGGGYASLEQDSSGRYIIKYTGDYNILTSPLVLLEDRIKEMDRTGVDIQVLSLTTPGVEREPPQRGVKLAKVTNDAFSGIEKRYQRFKALATLPMQDPGAAADELARVYKDLGMKGAMIPSNVSGVPLDAPEFQPIFDRADKLGALLYIHPTSPMNTARMADYRLVPLIGFGVDTSLTVLRLVLGGVMERYPRLKLGASHLGGVYPLLKGRIDLGSEVYPETGVNITRLPSEYLKNIYVDSCGYDSSVIGFVQQWLGSSHILLGSDYPAQIADPAAVARVKPLKIPDGEKEQILGGNAAKLLGIE